jgi:hypothetical protein
MKCKVCPIEHHIRRTLNYSTVCTAVLRIAVLDNSAPVPNISTIFKILLANLMFEIPVFL